MSSPDRSAATVECWPCGCPKGMTPHGVGWKDCIFSDEQKEKWAREASPAAYMRYELPSRLAVETGSLLIERYSSEGPNGGKSVQWIVHRVAAGELENLRVFDTRREAAEFIVGGLHLGW